MKRLLICLLLIPVFTHVSAQDAQNLVVEANQAMNEGRYREAERLYLAALVREPQNWNIFTMYGFSVHKQRRFREADSLYHIVIQNDSSGSRVWWYKALNH